VKRDRRGSGIYRRRRPGSTVRDRRPVSLHPPAAHIPLVRTRPAPRRSRRRPVRRVPPARPRRPRPGDRRRGRVAAAGAGDSGRRDGALPVGGRAAGESSPPRVRPGHFRRPARAPARPVAGAPGRAALPLQRRRRPPGGAPRSGPAWPARRDALRPAPRPRRRRPRPPCLSLRRFGLPTSGRGPVTGAGRKLRQGGRGRTSSRRASAQRVDHPHAGGPKVRAVPGERMQAAAQRGGRDQPVRRVRHPSGRRDGRRDLAPRPGDARVDRKHAVGEVPARSARTTPPARPAACRPAAGRRRGRPRRRWSRSGTGPRPQPPPAPPGRPGARRAAGHRSGCSCRPGPSQLDLAHGRLTPWWHVEAVEARAVQQPVLERLGASPPPKEAVPHSTVARVLLYRVAMRHPAQCLTIPIRFAAAALMAVVLWACGPSFADEAWVDDGYGSLV
jgi:hypothetical protein